MFKKKIDTFHSKTQWCNVVAIFGHFWLCQGDDCLEQHGIDYVPKNINPPNVPQCRAIERYWSIVKKKLKTTQKTAKDEKDFALKWTGSTKKIKNHTVRNIMKDIKKKIRKEWDGA